MPWQDLFSGIDPAVRKGWDTASTFALSPQTETQQTARNTLLPLLLAPAAMALVGSLSRKRARQGNELGALQMFSGLAMNELMRPRQQADAYTLAKINSGELVEDPKGTYEWGGRKFSSVKPFQPQLEPQAGTGVPGATIWDKTPQEQVGESAIYGTAMPPPNPRYSPTDQLQNVYARAGVLQTPANKQAFASDTIKALMLQQQQDLQHQRDAEMAARYGNDPNVRISQGPKGTTITHMPQRQLSPSENVLAQALQDPAKAEAYANTKIYGKPPHSEKIDEIDRQVAVGIISSEEGDRLKRGEKPPGIPGTTLTPFQAAESVKIQQKYHQESGPFRTIIHDYDMAAGHAVEAKPHLDPTSGKTVVNGVAQAGLMDAYIRAIRGFDKNLGIGRMNKADQDMIANAAGGRERLDAILQGYVTKWEGGQLLPSTVDNIMRSFGVIRRTAQEVLDQQREDAIAGGRGLRMSDDNIQQIILREGKTSGFPPSPMNSPSPPSVSSGAGEYIWNADHTKLIPKGQ